MAFVDKTQPSGNFAAITPSDSTNLTLVTRGVYVGTGGNIVAVMANGSTVTFSNAAQGSVLPISVVRINATNTTASNLVALF